MSSFFILQSNRAATVKVTTTVHQQNLGRLFGSITVPSLMRMGSRNLKFCGVVNVGSDTDLGCIDGEFDNYMYFRIYI
jgi:hypothetical protein